MVIKEESIETKGITPAMFHILLSLAEGPQHGYGIGKSVEISSGGNFHLGPGTLYRTLELIRGFGWVRYSKKKIMEMTILEGSITKLLLMVKRYLSMSLKKWKQL